MKGGSGGEGRNRHPNLSTLTELEVTETNEERKMMEADVQGVSQATTVAVALQNTMAVAAETGGECGGESS